MKITSLVEAAEVCELIEDVLIKGKRQYTRYVSNGASIHTYTNFVHTIEGYIAVIRQMIEKKDDVRVVQAQIDLAVHYVYRFAKWIGEQIP